MQVIGFNLTKILAERFPDFKSGPINTNIEFTNVEEDKVSLIKDSEVVKINFKYSVIYSEQKEQKKQDKKKADKAGSDKEESKRAEVSFEGNVLLTLSKDELKNIQKEWKKKQIPSGVQFPLYNLILKKCSIRAAQLEDELNIPPHLPIPQLRRQQPPQQ